MNAALRQVQLDLVLPGGLHALHDEGFDLHPASLPTRRAGKCIIGGTTPMTDQIRAAYFDLDGTLADTVDLILAAHAHTFHAHLGTPGPPREVIVGNMGRSLTDAIREYVAAEGHDDVEGLAQAMLTTYRAFQREHHQGLTHGYPGMRAVLEGLAGRGLTLAVVTSKVEWMARLTLADVGLERFVPVGVFHDDTERHKPDPAPLLLAAKRTGIAPAETVLHRRQRRTTSQPVARPG